MAPRFELHARQAGKPGLSQRVAQRLAVVAATAAIDLLLRQFAETTLVAMVLWRRPFCGVICPLGAIFSLFHRMSAWDIRWEEERCVHCQWCVRACPQGIDPRYEVNGHRCVGCLECQKCPYDAIYSAPKWSPQREAAPDEAPEQATP